jgi:hypothetical protein
MVFLGTGVSVINVGLGKINTSVAVGISVGGIDVAVAVLGTAVAVVVSGIAVFVDVAGTGVSVNTSVGGTEVFVTFRGGVHVAVHKIDALAPTALTVGSTYSSNTKNKAKIVNNINK